MIVYDGKWRKWAHCAESALLQPVNTEARSYTHPSEACFSKSCLKKYRGLFLRFKDMILTTPKKTKICSSKNSFLHCVYCRLKEVILMSRFTVPARPQRWEYLFWLFFFWANKSISTWSFLYSIFVSRCTWRDNRFDIGQLLIRLFSTSVHSY